MGIFPSRILGLLKEKSWGSPSVALGDGRTGYFPFPWLFFLTFPIFLVVNLPKNAPSLQLPLSCELQLFGIHPRGCNPQEWCGAGPKIQEKMSQESKLDPKILMWGGGVRLDREGAGAPIPSGFLLCRSKILQLPQHLCSSSISFLLEEHQRKFSSWKSKVCHSQAAENPCTFCNYNSQLFAAWKSNRENSGAWCLVFTCTTHSQFGILWQIWGVKEHGRDLFSSVEWEAIPEVSLLPLGKIPGH